MARGARAPRPAGGALVAQRAGAARRRARGGAGADAGWLCCARGHTARRPANDLACSPRRRRSRRCRGIDDLRGLPVRLRLVAHRRGGAARPRGLAADRVPGRAAAAARPRRRVPRGCGSSSCSISWTGSTASPGSRRRCWASASRSCSLRPAAASDGTAALALAAGAAGARLPVLELAPGADLSRRCRQRAAGLSPRLAAAARWRPEG